MLLLNKDKVGSAKQQIAIKGVSDDVLILPNDRYCAVIETSSINFELKSEAEQDALIDTYQSFLNSLGSSIQILIRTREVDLDNYLQELQLRANKEEQLAYQGQLLDYAEFIRKLVNVNRILSRSFYVIVPVEIVTKHDFSFAKEQLGIKTDIVIKGLQRLGMHTRALTSLEILNLFYAFYNPQQAKFQPLSTAALRLMHLAVTSEVKQ